MRRSLSIGTLAVLTLTPALAQWAPDASKAAIPGRAAVGRIHGKVFRVEKAELQIAAPSPETPKRTTYFLKLTQGKAFFADYEYSLTLLTPRGQKIDGKAFVVGPEGVFKMAGAIEEKGVTYPPVQGVMMTWKVPGKTFGDTDLSSKYTMRLQFGKAKGNRIPGHVFIAMQDREKSWVSGTFQASIHRLGDPR